MPGRYVKALIYRVEPHNYEKPPPLVRELEDFTVRVENGEAKFEFKRVFETEDEACETVRDYIADWEFLAQLERGPGAFRLRLDRPEFTAPNAIPGEVRLTTGSLHASAGMGSPTIVSHPRSYPEPPSATNGIKMTPDVRSMWDRYVGYRRDQERLPSMAYFA